MKKLILAIFVGCCFIACGEKNSDDTASVQLDSGMVDPEDTGDAIDTGNSADTGDTADAASAATDVSYVEFDAVDVTITNPDAGE
jgi:hypothetical protein